jgi:hypothetical protein
MDTIEMSRSLTIQVDFEKEGKEEYPIVSKLYDFFSPNCKQAEVWSIGFGSGDIETDIVERLGCELKIFDVRPESKKIYDEVIETLKQHKPYENKEEYNKIAKKWVKDNKFIFYSHLPYTFTGTLDICGNVTELKAIDSTVNPRLNFLKIDYPSFTSHILHSILHAGYRPGLILVKWDKHPDNYTESMLSAGNLQTTGYSLIGEKDNWFLYMFNDLCGYETTSWARTDFANPMFEEYRKMLLESIHNVK